MIVILTPPARDCESLKRCSLNSVFLNFDGFSHKALNHSAGHCLILLSQRMI